MPGRRSPPKERPRGTAAPINVGRPAGGMWSPAQEAVAA